MKRLIKSMKYFSALSLAFILILGLQGCNKDSSDTTICESYNFVTPEYRSFEISVTCTDMDGEPLVGWEVSFEFYKEYCDGSYSGEQTHTNITNSDGKTFSPFTPEFKYVNPDDKVYVNVFLTIGTNRYSVLYNWEDVDEVDEEYIIDLANRKKVIKHFDIKEL